MRRERGSQRRLTFEASNGQPVWSPDGKRIAFASSRDGSWNLYWRAADGSGGDDGAAAAVIEAALADDRPRPGMWLCHGFCALGATEFDTARLSLAAVPRKETASRLVVVKRQPKLLEVIVKDGSVRSAYFVRSTLPLRLPTPSGTGTSVAE